jgi:methionyl-tRNA formyltransferase
MDPKKLRIIFMGTPGFAVESLKALVENGYHIVAVITAPDKPAGQGAEIVYFGRKAICTRKRIASNSAR